MPVQEDYSDPAGFADSTLGAIMSNVPGLPIVWPSPGMLAEVI
jgi:hypothetical protein